MDGMQAQLTSSELGAINGLKPRDGYLISQCYGGWALQQVLGSLLGQEIDPTELALVESAVIGDSEMASDWESNDQNARAA